MLSFFLWIGNYLHLEVFLLFYPKNKEKRATVLIRGRFTMLNDKLRQNVAIGDFHVSSVLKIFFLDVRPQNFKSVFFRCSAETNVNIWRIFLLSSLFSRFNSEFASNRLIGNISSLCPGNAVGTNKYGAPLSTSPILNFAPPTTRSANKFQGQRQYPLFGKIVYILILFVKL